MERFKLIQEIRHEMQGWPSLTLSVLAFLLFAVLFVRGLRLAFEHWPSFFLDSVPWLLASLICFRAINKRRYLLQNSVAALASVVLSFLYLTAVTLFFPEGQTFLIAISSAFFASVYILLYRFLMRRAACTDWALHK
jgi:hypothetical protein